MSAGLVREAALLIMHWHDLSTQEVEHCSETASWPMLIVSQTRATVDITAHLFPAQNTCDPPRAAQLRKLLV